MAAAQAFSAPLALAQAPASSGQAAPPSAPAAPQQTAPAQAQAQPPAEPAPVPAHQKTLAVVILDPAHGGADPGARGASGIAESDVVLGVALLVRISLE